MKSRRGSDDAADTLVEVIITVAPWADRVLQPSETSLTPSKVCNTHHATNFVAVIAAYISYIKVLISCRMLHQSCD